MEAEDNNKEPIVLETTLEEMKQMEYVNSLSRRKKLLNMLQTNQTSS